MSAPAISDYALIGDCESAALVSREGSIDWLCWPRFDSDACFARLLGDEKHGRWSLAPVCEARVSRRYLPGTLVLETRFETEQGSVALTDFMPIRGGEASNSTLVRILRGESGSVDMTMDLAPRFQYGTIVPWLTRRADDTLRLVAGPHAVHLRSSHSIHERDGRLQSHFTLQAGESAVFTATYGASHLPDPDTVNADAALRATVQAWSHWSTGSRYEGGWQDAVERSLITIKALTYRPTGGVIAAPTTSLPECVGGERNWDYRYCWLRDSTFTLSSLLNAGYRQEASAWCDWLLRAVAGSANQLQPMYGLSGEPDMPERVLDWLPGYRNSVPVRVGNAARDQLQLDVYGNIIDSLYEAACAGVDIHEANGGLQRRLLEHLEGLWPRKDEGIWEMRANTQHFVHSKLMCWVAFDRAVRSAEQHGLRGPVERWRRHRESLRAEILEHGYNDKVGAFTQAYGSNRMDAAVLLIPIMGFLPADDPRVVSTVKAVERQLLHDGLVLRYDTRRVDDGLPPGEGAFIARTFWLIDNYILQGRGDEAQALFERVLALRNDVGLLAEEYDTGLNMQVGNFPQAFSHFALIDTAFNFHGKQGVAAQADAAVATGECPVAGRTE